MGSSLLVTEGDGFSLSVKKPKAIIKGERGEVFSLLDRLCRNRRCRLLTFGEETEGAGFLPGVKKPKVRR